MRLYIVAALGRVPDLQQRLIVGVAYNPVALRVEPHAEGDLSPGVYGHVVHYLYAETHLGDGGLLSIAKTPVGGMQYARHQQAAGLFVERLALFTQLAQAAYHQAGTGLALQFQKFLYEFQLFFPFRVPLEGGDRNRIGAAYDVGGALHQQLTVGVKAAHLALEEVQHSRQLGVEQGLSVVMELYHYAGRELGRYPLYKAEIHILVEHHFARALRLYLAAPAHPAFLITAVGKLKVDGG